MFLASALDFNGGLMQIFNTVAAADAGLFSKRPIPLNRLSAAYSWRSDAIFNCCFWTGYSYCVDDSNCPPKLLVHCVAASILPIAIRPHEQKLQLAGSHCDVPGVIYAHFAWTGEGNCLVH